MSKIFSIIQHDDFTEMRFSSSPNAQDGLEAIREQAALGKVHRKRLWDMSCGYDLSAEELQTAAMTSRSQHQVFRGREEAIAWLNEPDDENQTLT